MGPMILDPQFLTTEMETHRILAKWLGVIPSRGEHRSRLESDTPARSGASPRVEPIYHFVSIERTHASAT